MCVQNFGFIKKTSSYNLNPPKTHLKELLFNVKFGQFFHDAKISTNTCVYWQLTHENSNIMTTIKFATLLEFDHIKYVVFLSNGKHVSANFINSIFIHFSRHS